MSKSREALHNDPNQPDYWHPEYRAIEPTLEYLLDMFEGRRRWLSDDGSICDATKAHCYLPKAEAQEPEQYLDQLKKSVFICFFKTAITKDFAPLLTRCSYEGESSFGEYLDDVDLKGNDLKSFLFNVVVAALRDGSAFILVDKPSIEKETEEGGGDETGEGKEGKDRLITLADPEANDRAYFVLYRRDQVTNWQKVMTRSGERLASVTFREEIYKPDGDYGVKRFEQYRVLYADGRYELHEREIIGDSENSKGLQDEGVTKFERVRRGTYDATSIPLVGLGFGDDPFCCEPPLTDFADLNLDHYRVRSGHRTTLDSMQPTLTAKEPQNFTKNEDSKAKKLIIGAASVIWNLDVDWLEPTGRGVEPAERSMAKTEALMEKLTISFFTGGGFGKTATEVELDAGQSEATLLGFAHKIESAMQQALVYWAEYMGEDPEKAGEIKVDTNLTKAKKFSLTDLIEAESTGFLSKPLAYEVAKSQGLFEDIDPNFIEQEMRQGVASEPEVA